MHACQRVSYVLEVGTKNYNAYISCNTVTMRTKYFHYIYYSFACIYRGIHGALGENLFPMARIDGADPPWRQHIFAPSIVRALFAWPTASTHTRTPWIPNA